MEGSESRLRPLCHWVRRRDERWPAALLASAAPAPQSPKPQTQRRQLTEPVVGVLLLPHDNHGCLPFCEGLKVGVLHVGPQVGAPPVAAALPGSARQLGGDQRPPLLADLLHHLDQDGILLEGLQYGGRPWRGQHSCAPRAWCAAAAAGPATALATRRSPRAIKVYNIDHDLVRDTCGHQKRCRPGRNPAHLRRPGKARLMALSRSRVLSHAVSGFRAPSRWLGLLGRATMARTFQAVAEAGAPRPL